MVRLWPLAQRFRVQSQAMTVPFPMGKADEDEGSFDEVDEEDAEGSEEDDGGRGGGE